MAGDEIDISEDEPLHAFIKIANAIKPRPDGVEGYPSDLEIRQYLHALHAAARIFDVSFKPDEPFGIRKEGKSYYREQYNAIVDDLAQKRAEDLIQRSLRKSGGTVLDNAWRAKIHTYCAHIRGLVETENLEAGLRQSIMNRIADLEKEIDRNRTRVEAFASLLIDLCTAVGTGAKRLEPAVKLVERVIGAIGRLPLQPPTLQLPPPENYGLDNMPEPQLPTGDANPPVEA